MTRVVLFLLIASVAAAARRPCASTITTTSSPTTSSSSTSTTTTLPCSPGTYTYQTGATGCGNPLCGATTLETFLWEGSPTTPEYGFLVSVGTIAGQTARGLFQFNVADLPADGILTSATLELTILIVDGTPSAGHVCRLRRTNWVAADATWNSYATGLDWQSPGASNTTTDVESPGSGDTTCTTYVGPLVPGLLDLDVLGFVRDAVANQGSAVRLWMDQDNHANAAFFDAGDHTQGTAAPLLSVSFVCVTTTSTSSSTSTSTSTVPTTTSTSTSTSTVPTTTSTSTSHLTTTSTSSTTSTNTTHTPTTSTVPTTTSTSTSLATTTSTSLATTTSTSTSTSLATTTSTAAPTTTSTSTSTSTSTAAPTTTSTSSTTSTAGATTTTLAFVQDNFERGSLGANWDIITTDPNCTITGSSDLTATGTDGFNAYCQYNAFTPATVSYACAKIQTFGNGDMSVCLGMDNTGSGHGTCCEFDVVVSDHNEDFWVSARLPLGTSPTDGVSCGDSGTTIGFTAPPDTAFFGSIERDDADTYRCRWSTDGTTWTTLVDSCTLLTTFDNTDASNPGFAGIGTFKNSPTPSTVEQWEAGNGTSPTGHVCGG